MKLTTTALAALTTALGSLGMGDVSKFTAAPTFETKDGTTSMKLGESTYELEGEGETLKGEVEVNMTTGELNFAKAKVSKASQTPGFTISNKERRDY